MTSAATLPAKPVGEPRVAPSVEELIAARQAAMAMSGAVLGSLESAADGRDVKKLAYPAGGLARWAKAMPALFPAGTGPNDSTAKTNAKVEVWSDRAGFERAVDDFAVAARTLRETAQAGDTTAWKAQVDAVQKTCDACHAAYKAPRKP